MTADGAGAWSYTTTALTNGSHSLTATATDAAGNTGVASVSMTVIVNAPVPNAPIISSFGMDSGVAGDGITNDDSLMLTGAAEAGGKVNIYDGATLLGSATVDATGAWTYTTEALTSGVHSFTATVTDSADNTSAASSALSVTVDTTAPLVPTITSFSADSGFLGDRVTNDDTPTFIGTAEANSTVKFYDGTMLLGSTIANSTGAWSFAANSLANGTHSLIATTNDVAGNTSTSSAFALTIDNLSPLSPSIEWSLIDNGSRMANDNTVMLTGMAEAGSSAKIYDGGTLMGSALVSDTGMWSFTTGLLADGVHDFTATATDAAGNTSGVSTDLIVQLGHGNMGLSLATHKGHVSLSDNSNGTALLSDNSFFSFGQFTDNSSAMTWRFEDVTNSDRVWGNGPERGYARLSPQADERFNARGDDLNAFLFGGNGPELGYARLSSLAQTDRTFAFDSNNPMSLHEHALSQIAANFHLV